MSPIYLESQWYKDEFTQQANQEEHWLLESLRQRQDN